MDTMSRNTHPEVAPPARRVPIGKRVDNALWHWPYYIEMGW